MPTSELWFVGALLGVSSLMLLRLAGERGITRDGSTPD
jgi:hypothetical protein